MTFAEACGEAIKEAKTNAKLCYVYYVHDTYRLSFRRFDKWLFRAYPGGRKELSRKGTEIAKEEGAL